MACYSMRTFRSRLGGWWVAVLLSLPVLQSRTRGELRNAAGSPHEQGLRPAEPWRIATLPESSDNWLDPPPTEREQTRLLALLGNNYDANFMSETRPNATTRVSWDFPFRRDWRGRLIPTGEMPHALQTLHLGYVRLPDGRRLKTGVSGKLKKKLRRLLWAYTSCPVQWRWKDLGLRFWPRWLKQGRCSQGKEVSCSVPPGMRCRPSATKNKTFLRWHCSRGEECKWRPIEYPVITQCSCSCSHIVRPHIADTTQI